MEPTSSPPTRRPSTSLPRLPKTYVPRARLWQQLDRATHGSLTLLVAPPGAGKTLGVSGWIQEALDADRRAEVEWIHADDTWDASRIDAVLDHAPITEVDVPAVDRSDEPRLVIVDDAHLLPAGTLRSIDTRLNAAPETMRLLLLSRWDLPLSRLVPELLGHFTIIRGDVLRMDNGEAAILIAEHARTNSPVVAAAVIERAQGWCAAVVLTARAIGTSADPEAAVARYAEADARVADRIASEVFAALRPRERHLLLSSAPERRVTVATAAHLSHNPDAGEILTDLETTGLLVSRVGGSHSEDEGDTEYRIHPILAEIIRRRLVAGGVDVVRAQATVVRAVRLDLARGDSVRAFDRLVAVQEHDLAAEVLVDHGVDLVMRGQGPAIAEFVRHHPDCVSAVPGAWFAVALERWIENDVEAARHWMDRVLESGVDTTSARVACIRLMRARLGLEPLFAAVGNASRVVQSSPRDPASDAALPQLLTELGITQTWIGDLGHAEVNLTSAINLCRHRNLPALAASATSHLAFTQYSAGREHVSLQLATEAMAMLGEALPWRPRFAGSRASLVLLLAGLVDLPWPTAPIEASAKGTAVHAADLTTRFWLRVRDARLALTAGSASDAERILETPLELPTALDQLPDHLHVALLLERAFVAGLCADRTALRNHEVELAGVRAFGEASLVAGLRADLDGDRRTAVTLFATAAEDITYSQPASRALALTCEAQLLDALGEPDVAMDRLREAAISTEVRRNAVPFLGWCRQGTPMETLLRQLNEQASSPWIQELSAAADGRPDISAAFAATTLTPRERNGAPEPMVRPTLSPREREVLNELARGSTYADIAANLFVSENTVKTHVSSLYGKLAVSRRSEALAVGRSMHLL